jgi:ferredoxin
VDECIDCGVCEPECPVEAIKPDTEPGLEKWLSLNAEYAKIWPNIAVKKSPHPTGRSGRESRTNSNTSRQLPARVIEADSARAAGRHDQHLIGMPFPFGAWHALAWMSELLPKPAITRNQVELMQIDTIASPERPGLAELGISPHAVEEILQQIMSEH